MVSEKNIYLHIIDIQTNSLITKHLSSLVPSKNDEIRVGGEENEKFYKVVQVVWCLDEFNSPYERVNLGVVLM